MILKSVKHRFGFAVVIAATAVLTAVVTGGSMIAAAIMVAVVVGVLGMAFAGRDRQSPEPEALADRESGGPWFFSYTWTVEEPVDLMAIYHQLRERGSATDLECRSQERIVAIGGSQLRSRLFGGYFVDPRRLPVRITIEATPNADGSSTLAVQVRDRFGIAIRDRALEERYAQAAEIVRAIAEPSPG
jgi:hypothetical protein